MRLVKSDKDRYSQEDIERMQAQLLRMQLRQMKSDIRKERFNKVASAAKGVGRFAAKTIAPKQTITKSETNRKLFSAPSDMFDASKVRPFIATNRSNKNNSK